MRRRGGRAPRRERNWKVQEVGGWELSDSDRWYGGWYGRYVEWGRWEWSARDGWEWAQAYHWEWMGAGFWLGFVSGVFFACAMGAMGFAIVRAMS